MEEQFLEIKKETIKCMITFVDWVSRTTRNENMFIDSLKVVLRNFSNFWILDSDEFYDIYFISFLEKRKIKLLSSKKRQCIVNFFDELKVFTEKYQDKFPFILNKLYKEELSSQLRFPMKNVSFGDLPPDKPKTKIIKRLKMSIQDKALFYTSSQKRRMKNQSHDFKKNIKMEFESFLTTFYNPKQIKRIIRHLDKKVTKLVTKQEKKIDHLKVRQATKYFLEIIIMEETKLINQGYDTTLL